MDTRKTDILGRIVIPKDLRAKYDIDDESAIDIIPTEDGILLKKHEPTCSICGGSGNLVSLKGKNFCRKCILKLNDLIK